MICTNVVTGMLAEIDITGTPTTPFNQTQIQENLNVSEAIESWSPTEFTFYDFVFGLLKWFGKAGTLITGFPNMLISFDVPIFIAQPLVTLWYFMFFTFIILGLIGGRDL